MTDKVPDRCQAYTERSVPLARGGRRHVRCKKRAVATRTYGSPHWSGIIEREVALCGGHLAMFDRGNFPPRLESDERR